MKNRIYESMTRVVVGRYTVRVWRTESSFVLGPNYEVLQRLKGLVDMDREMISSTLDALSDIAAYEILDEQGHGSIVYPDWK